MYVTECEIASKDEMRKEGARLLNEMDVCVPYVKDFEANGNVYLF